MKSTPKGMRVQIGIFGRRNAGKSSLLNALTSQSVSIVSETAGTTTDPVEKAMELQPLGPVLFIDTAGLDDAGKLGSLRVKKSKRVLDRIDLAMVVGTSESWSDFEFELIAELKKTNIPAIAVINKTDICDDVDQPLADKIGYTGAFFVKTSAVTGSGLNELREAIIKAVPERAAAKPVIVGDLVPPGEPVVLVVPIDLEAPKGRLILPQVQTIRDALDNDSWCIITKEREFPTVLERLNTPPALVVTDSQAFLKVAADTPADVPLTSFSILFARLKGNLETLVAGAMSIENLKTADKVLVAEACCHHPIGEDIGRVKIPRWLTQYVGGKLEFTHVQGHDYPDNLEDYKLIIHCGACTFNRQEMLTRINNAAASDIPITNYGVSIAYTLGIIEKAVKPFPAAYEIVKQALEPRT